MPASNARDIHLAEALHLAEERFFATFELAPVGIAHVAPDGRWLRVNQRLCEILGYDCDELLGMRFQQLTYPEDLAADLDQALRTLAGEQSRYEIEKRYVRKDGAPVWVNVRVALVREKASERPLYFVTVVDDITEQRRAEEALSRYATEIRTLLDGLPDIVTRFDAGGRHLYVNPAVERATGFPASHFLGRTNRELGMPEPLVTQWEEAIRRVVEGNEPVEIEFEFPTPDGPRHYWSRLVPEHDERGRAVGVLGVARDFPPEPPAEDRFRRIADSGMVGVVHWRLDGRITRANDYVLDLLGYTAEDVEAGRLNEREITPPGWEPADDAARAELRATGRVRAFEKEYLHRDGHRVPLLVASATLPEDAEQGVSLVIDQRARRAMEQALRESEERFRFLAEMIPHLVWSTLPDGSHDYYNGRWFDYTGLTYDETRGGGWNTVLHPDDQKRAWSRWRRSLDSGEPYVIEYRFRRHDGVYRWFLGLALPLRDGNGEIVRWFGTCTDIQVQKDAEAALTESQERLHAALAASGTGTFRWDIPTGTLEWDDALDRLFGLPEGETARSTDAFLALVHPEDRARVRTAMEHCRVHGMNFEEEFRVVWPDGTVRWLVDKGRTQLDREGRPRSMTGACVDVSDRKQAELEREELLAQARAARAEAEAASRLKSQFLANMSHEIRTPINAVLGYADLLEVGVSGTLNEAQTEFVRRLKGGGRHLLTLVNDILDLAKVEAGELQVAVERVPVRASLLGALDIADPLFSQRGVRVSGVGDCAPSLTTRGDADRIRQVLVNLLSNAAKFTPQGGEVRLRCRVVPGDAVAADGWVVIEVEDTGAGIAPEMQERVFEPFVQATEGAERRPGGTGLGLTISRTLARLMGGDLTLSSPPGAGACFSLWLPTHGADD